MRGKEGHVLYLLTSKTVRAENCTISDEISVNLFEASISLVRSTISHHLSPSAQSSETFLASGGTSKLTLHTLSGTSVRPRLERFSWPDFRAWRNRASETPPSFSWATPRPNPGFLGLLCMVYLFRDLLIVQKFIWLGISLDIFNEQAFQAMKTSSFMLWSIDFTRHFGCNGGCRAKIGG